MFRWHRSSQEGLHLEYHLKQVQNKTVSGYNQGDIDDPSLVYHKFDLVPFGYQFQSFLGQMGYFTAQFGDRLFTYLGELEFNYSVCPPDKA
jgi:hypothetical protein